MPVEIVMPKLGLTMASGTIARWIKSPGEPVREGEPLVEVSTDKIAYEVESPASGTFARSLGNDGDEFACGDVIGYITLAGEADVPHAKPAEPPPSSAPDVVASGDAPAQVVEAPRVSAAANGVLPTAESSIIVPERNGARVVASPAARRLARERGLTLGTIRGTGPRGRITLSDVHAHVPAASRASAEPDATSIALPPRLPAARRAIYRKMVEVGRLPLAQVETVARVDAVQALIARRRDFGWTAFAVYAVARLLRAHPDLRTDATTGAPFEQIGIGVAADTPHGLIVPVVRDADRRSLAEIHAEIVRLAGVARDGTIASTDVGGASFSISNVGPQGVERVAPLPDPPQSAILGIGAATQRPAVVEGVVVPAWMLTCVLSFDHRFVDGAPAARFLAAFAAACADPGVLL
ncbi:MAG TPA: dihydrolipoamide acetyltransferase family protein [Candidatus Elarobacter sp.]|jgi:pyruvate dehydrogenase E2 component (dihydrolipoamide acetyltransferase)|nr:dihydrolipoamide acetyltransferase family protein [Candidatus Elarobacter sp.]